MDIKYIQKVSYEINEFINKKTKDFDIIDRISFYLFMKDIIENQLDEVLKIDKDILLSITELQEKIIKDKINGKRTIKDRKTNK